MWLAAGPTTWPGRVRCGDAARPWPMGRRPWRPRWPRCRTRWGFDLSGRLTAQDDRARPVVFGEFARPAAAWRSVQDDDDRRGLAGVREPQRQVRSRPLDVRPQPRGVERALEAQLPPGAFQAGAAVDQLQGVEIPGALAPPGPAPVPRAPDPH